MEGAGQAFVVEFPQVFQTAATSTEDQHVAFAAFSCRAQRVANLVCCAGALNRCRVEHDAHVRRPALQGGDDIAQRRCLG